jgi:hypothetical protein
MTADSVDPIGSTNASWLRASALLNNPLSIKNASSMGLRSGGASLGVRYNSRSTILSTTPDEQGSASLEEEDSGVSEERRVLKQSPEQAHLLLTIR